MDAEQTDGEYDDDHHQHLGSLAPRSYVRRDWIVTGAAGAAVGAVPAV